MDLRWTLHYANLDPVVGSEQGKSRPVLVISDEGINQKLSTLTVLPVTSRKPGREIYPNEVLLAKGIGGLEKESIILCHQIRTLDRKRFIKFLGVLDDAPTQQEIAEALRFHLGL